MTLRKVYAALNRNPIQTNATLFVHEVKITKGQVYILKVPKRKRNDRYLVFTPLGEVKKRHREIAL